MEKPENIENKEINEIEKEEIAKDIKKALEKQAAESKPIDPAVQTEEPKPSDQAEQTTEAEQLPQTEEPKPETAEKPTPAKSPKLPKIPKPSELIGRIRKLSKKNGLLLVLVELILLLFLAVILTQHISLNSGDPASDSGFIDEISCADGQLSVNTVSVSVPAESGVSYSISYDWGKNDKDYPTVPKVAIASYHSDSGDLKYDISLYRESFTPAKKVPAGKKPSNWFSDWKTVNDEHSKQEPKKSGDINGFLISTVGNEPEGAYETTSYYFAVRTKEGISVYVAEGLLYDKEDEKEFNKVMEDVIKSIRTKKQAA